MVNLGTHLKRNVSQIVYLRLSFLSIIVLSTTTESLNIFHKILIEISAFKNMKVKIQILHIIFDKFLLFCCEQ